MIFEPAIIIDQPRDSRAGADTATESPSTFSGHAAPREPDNLRCEQGVALTHHEDFSTRPVPESAGNCVGTSEHDIANRASQDGGDAAAAGLLDTVGGFSRPESNLAAAADLDGGDGGHRHAATEALSEASVTEENRRKNLLENFADFKKQGFSTAQSCKLLGVSRISIWRYQQEKGLTLKTNKCGRKPGYLPSPNELACVKEIYSRLDESDARGRGLGSSKITAFRLAAKSDDQRVSEMFKAFVLRARVFKRVPPSWMRLLDLPASAIDYGRDKKAVLSSHISTPRSRSYIDARGNELPIRAGTIFEADDGTLNFYAWIPWPFGGDPCSEKYGVKLGRWQLLAVVDVASNMCVNWHVVSREKSSYRAEDSGTLLGTAMIEECIPELWRLERGSWESHFVRDLLKLVGVASVNAWHSKQKNAVENFFDRLWTPASMIPGHVGRDRARFTDVEKMAMACYAGRRDPREHFLALNTAVPKLNKAVEFVNTEPVVSNVGWGRWVPQERYATQMAEQPRAKLDPSQAVFFSREQRVWTVRKATLGGNVEGPLMRFPTYFQCPELWEFEACKVKCYFDPYADEVVGTLVLQHEWRTFRSGHIIARDVPALELPPQAVLAEDGWDDAGQKRSLAIRKAISKAVRTEYCNWRGGRTTEARDGRGGVAVKTSSVEPRIISSPARVPTPAPAPQLSTRNHQQTDSRLAERARRLREFEQ